MGFNLGFKGLNQQNEERKIAVSIHNSLSVSTDTLDFYSKTNQMHNISNLFYFATTLYILFLFISNLIHCFSVYVQYLLSSFLYMFQASQAHHQEV